MILTVFAISSMSAADDRHRLMRWRAPVGHVEQAVRTARSSDVDAAILDVNLHGQQVFPVADTLRERKIPFVFVTGYSSVSMPDRFGAHPMLRKPVKYNELWTALSRLKRPEPGETGH